MKYNLAIYLTFSFFVFVSCNNLHNTNSPQDDEVESHSKNLNIDIYDSSVLSIIDTNVNIEILAKGLQWSEGPLWLDNLQSLIFSDVPANKIYKWNETEGLSVYLEPSGYTSENYNNSNSGSNGLILDKDNNLLICQHGDRRIARLDSDLKNPESKFVTIAENYKGKKFNSPNDLVMDKEANVYFTDPPYGLPGNKTGEVGINGVYKISHDKEVTLLVDSLNKPNGIGLSIDQKTLYINQSDPNNQVLYSYEINEDGSLENGKILFNFQSEAKELKGLPDGLKVHKSGNIFSTGPGGIHIISPDGKLLALIYTDKPTANCAFDTEQKYLYMTTSDMLTRLRLTE